MNSMTLAAHRGRRADLPEALRRKRPQEGVAAPGFLSPWVVGFSVFFAYPLIDALTGHAFPAAPVFGVAPCPSAIFTAGLLLWTRRGVPMYVPVVPVVWLMSQTPAEALAMGVVAVPLIRTVRR